MPRVLTQSVSFQSLVAVSVSCRVVAAVTKSSNPTHLASVQGKAHAEIAKVADVVIKAKAAATGTDAAAGRP